MRRRALLVGGIAGASLAFTMPAFAARPANILFWHSMRGRAGAELAKLIGRFNAGQTLAQVTPVFKGGYGESLTAAMAAWRAGNAPHIIQMAGVGTAAMIASGPAVRDVWQLARETGIALDPAAYLAAARGYYSLADGRMASVPFAASTAILWYNKDAFEKAGLDPERAPATWPELLRLADTLKSKRVTKFVCTSARPAWIQFEQFAAIHNIPYATDANGFAGLGARLLIDGPAFVRNLQRLLAMSAAGTFTYDGDGPRGVSAFSSGDAAMLFAASSARRALAASANFRFGGAVLPFDPGIIEKPLNSTVGGTSLWVMTAPHRTGDEYKAAAEFLAFLAQPEQDAEWASATGDVPVTLAGSKRLEEQGFYRQNPGVRAAITQLARAPMTVNSRGVRLGRLPKIRAIIEQEWKRALSGGHGAQAVLRTASNQGDAVLRAFQQSVG